MAEYTTTDPQRDNKQKLYKKLETDLHNCFDEEKTGISITEIEKIVLCHNSTLDTKEENSLKEECQKYGIELDIFGIDSISFDLYKNYRGIARDFLGVEVDTGQIVNLDEFITTYNKRKIVAPLDTKFYFRENEIKEILQRLKYRHLDKNVVAQVTEIILSKINEQTNYADPFDFLFNPYTQANHVLIELFTEKLDVLKQAYLLSQKIRGWSSNSEDIFIRILDADQNFIIEYINWVYTEERKLSNSPYFRDELNYTFLWQYENHQELITQIVEHIYQKEKELSTSGFRNTILERIFVLEVTEEKKVVLEDRQNKLLESLIENRYQDIDLMQLLFSVVTTFSDERRYQFIDLFCKYNRNFEDFKKLPLEPFIWSWSESLKPTHESYTEYLKSLLPIFNQIDFLEHRKYVEQEIKYFQKWIEDEKKKDFMRD